MMNIINAPNNRNSGLHSTSTPPNITKIAAYPKILGIFYWAIYSNQETKFWCRLFFHLFTFNSQLAYLLWAFDRSQEATLLSISLWIYYYQLVLILRRVLVHEAYRFPFHFPSTWISFNVGNILSCWVRMRYWYKSFCTRTIYTNWHFRPVAGFFSQ